MADQKKPGFQLGRLQHETILPYVSISGPFTIEVSNESGVKPVGETLARRHPAARDGLLTTPDPAIHTVYDILKYGLEHHADKQMMGWRKVLKVHRECKVIRKQVNDKVEEIEKIWTYSELSPYQYITYGEYDKLVHQIGSGLAGLGLSRSDHLHIFASTG